MKDFLDPAIKGTTGILKAIKAYAPTVKRVVITSSFAAIVNPKQHPKVYSEKEWNPVTWEEAMDHANVYRASKVSASDTNKPRAGLIEHALIRPLQKRLPGTLLRRRSLTLTSPPLTLHLSLAPLFTI